MTRCLATMLLVSLLFGCGRYGAPIRVGAAADAGGVSAVTDHDSAACEDPEHDHEETP